MESDRIPKSDLNGYRNTYKARASLAPQNNNHNKCENNILLLFQVCVAFICFQGIWKGLVREKTEKPNQHTSYDEAHMWLKQ